MVRCYEEERSRGLKLKTGGVRRKDICGADDRVFTGWWLFKRTSILQLAHVCTAHRVVTSELAGVDQSSLSTELKFQHISSRYFLLGFISIHMGQT